MTADTLEIARGRRRIYLWSQPRTCSNLIVRILETHHELEHILYPMMPPVLFGPDRVQVTANPAGFDRLVKALAPKFNDRSMQVAADEIQATIAEVEAKGKTVFIKDHVLICTRFEVMIGSPDLIIKCKDNKLDSPRVIAENSKTTADESSDKEIRTSSTIYSDRFLKSFSPVFSIRHPARMIPSYVRAAKRAWGESLTDPGFSVNTSYKWTRLLFDWYRSQPECEPGWPIVIDGDDLVNETEGVMKEFCQLSGLDPNGAQYTWEVGSNQFGYRPEEWKAADEVFGSTLNKSTSVEKEEKLTHEPVIEEELTKWITEFGEKDAKAIADAVQITKADYEYLRQFRLRPRSM